MTDIDPVEFHDNYEPDFTAVYEPHVDGDSSQMTPRMAWHLWSAALYLADEWRRGDIDSLLDGLPPIAQPYARDRGWRQQFVASFERIAQRLANGGEDDVLARCTADELALHKLIDLAEAHLIDDIFSPAAVSHLPDHGERDEDFYWMREVIFEDHDVLMLYNRALDGIENEVDGDSSLHPRDWFEPFRPLPAG
ncbi:MAG: hypothetical protein ACRD03_08205 [Acidimicrobiales bacterium]